MESLLADLSKYVNFNLVEKQALEKLLTRKEIKKGDHILKEGDICNFGVFIEKGCMRTYYNYQDIESTTHFFFENDWYADFESYFTEKPSMLNIEALENCTLYFLTKKDYEMLVAIHPTFNTFLDEMKERTIKGLTGMMKWKNLLSPEERYLELIKYGPKIIERVSLKHISNYLGIKPESLSRIRTRITLNSKS
ncbi:MAG: hypothetical protein QG594_1949 [Bacteroidota bacterium]|nr:hypothetical protein [Bacteroidota bacterium]